MLLPEVMLQEEMFIARAQQKREHVNANRPLGLLSPIDFTMEKSRVDRTKLQYEILEYLHGNVGEPILSSAVASLPADQMTLKGSKSMSDRRMALVVDDARHISEEASPPVCVFGFDTVIANNRAEAFAMAKEIELDSMVFNIRMPINNGMSVLKAIKNAEQKKAFRW